MLLFNGSSEDYIGDIDRLGSAAAVVKPYRDLNEELSLAPVPDEDKGDARLAGHQSTEAAPPPNVSIIPDLPETPTVTPIAEIITVTTDSYAPYTVADGAVIYATSLVAIFGSSGAGFMSPLTNNGTVWSEVSSDISTLAAIGRPNHIRGVENNGLMVLHLGPETTRNAFGFQEPSLRNSGQIYIINEGTGNAWALSTYLADATVNGGLIAVQALHGTAFGYQFNNGPPSFENRAGAQLLVEGMSAIAFYSASGGRYAPTQITNVGTIIANALDPYQLSFALYLEGGTNETYNITNSGLISASVAIFGGDDAYTVSGEGIQHVHNLAGGEINGLVYLQRGNDTLDNAGTINGHVYMGDGTDSVDNTIGAINGVTDLGWGSDSYKGGAAVDLVAGGRGGDQIEGGAGNDLLMGGSGNDVLIGGAGNDGLFGEWDNDRIVTSGGDVADGGAGNDRIELGDYTFALASGGDGFDTIALPGGTRTLNLTSALSEGAFADFEQIDLNGGKTLVVQSSDITAITGGDTALRIVTTATDRVDLVGAWLQGPNELIEGAMWRSYTLDGVKVLVGGNATVTPNASNASGNLDPVAGGNPAPLPGEGLLDFTDPVEIVSNFALTQSETIESELVFFSPDGSPVFVDGDGDTVLTNYGTILSVREAGTTAGYAAFALNTRNIEKILNYGDIIVVNDVVYGASSAFAVVSGWGNSGIVENRGLIRAVSAESTAQAVQSRDLYNYGVIEAHALSGGAFGFRSLGWNFENHGTISAKSDAAPWGPMYGLGAAVGAWLASSNSLNSGTIVAAAVTGGSMGVAYDLGSSAVLTNTGTISAEVAVFVRTQATNLNFKLINSNDITGHIRLGAEKDLVENGGRISGETTLGAGDDIFDGSRGLQGSVKGEDGNDILKGGSGADILGGGAGVDSLTGGAGNDMFRDSAAGLNGDTISDFAVGDKIVITDASFANFTYSLSGNTLTFMGGSLTFGSPISGPIFVSVAANGGVQISLAPNSSNDFNGDGRSDLLWASQDGTLTNWLGQPNGGFGANNANLWTVVSADWHVAGTGDFNGDGNKDIMWRNENGLIADWLGQANGGFVHNYTNSAAHVPTDWRVAGIGDFNGDGKDDLLWRHSDGTITDWLGQANGSLSGNYVNSVAQVPTDWRVAGIGDFNGDDKDDILWRHLDGTITDWLGQPNGGFAGNYVNSASQVPTDWRVAGIGDFNGDGKDDILWRHLDGTITNWLGGTNGSFSPNAANVWATPPTDWQVAGIGDFNGDGKDDILWRHEDGTLTDWLGGANGSFASNAANVWAGVPTDWHIQASDVQLV